MLYVYVCFLLSIIDMSGMIEDSHSEDLCIQADILAYYRDRNHKLDNKVLRLFFSQKNWVNDFDSFPLFVQYDLYKKLELLCETENNFSLLKLQLEWINKWLYLEKSGRFIKVNDEFFYIPLSLIEKSVLLKNLMEDIDEGEPLIVLDSLSNDDCKNELIRLLSCDIQCVSSMNVDDVRRLIDAYNYYEFEYDFFSADKKVIVWKIINETKEPLKKNEIIKILKWYDNKISFDDYALSYGNYLPLLLQGLNAECFQSFIKKIEESEDFKYAIYFYACEKDSIIYAMISQCLIPSWLKECEKTQIFWNCYKKDYSMDTLIDTHKEIFTQDWAYENSSYLIEEFIECKKGRISFIPKKQIDLFQEYVKYVLGAKCNPCCVWSIPEAALLIKNEELFKNCFHTLNENNFYMFKIVADILTSCEQGLYEVNDREYIKNIISKHIVFSFIRDGNLQDYMGLIDFYMNDMNMIHDVVSKESSYIVTQDWVSRNLDFFIYQYLLLNGGSDMIIHNHKNVQSCIPSVMKEQFSKLVPYALERCKTFNFDSLDKLPIAFMQFLGKNALLQNNLKVFEEIALLIKTCFSSLAQCDFLNFFLTEFTYQTKEQQEFVKRILAEKIVIQWLGDMNLLDDLTMFKPKNSSFFHKVMNDNKNIFTKQWAYQNKWCLMEELGKLNSGKRSIIPESMKDFFLDIILDLIIDQPKHYKDEQIIDIAECCIENPARFAQLIPLINDNNCKMKIVIDALSHQEQTEEKKKAIKKILSDYIVIPWLQSGTIFDINKSGYALIQELIDDNKRVLTKDWAEKNSLNLFCHFYQYKKQEPSIITPKTIDDFEKLVNHVLDTANHISLSNNYNAKCFLEMVLLAKNKKGLSNFIPYILKKKINSLKELLDTKDKCIKNMVLTSIGVPYFYHENMPQVMRNAIWNELTGVQKVTVGLQKIEQLAIGSEFNAAITGSVIGILGTVAAYALLKRSSVCVSEIKK